MVEQDKYSEGPMSEFGHLSGTFGSGGFIDCWGAGPFIIEALGTTFRFEDSDRFGPSRVNKDGEISKQPFFAEASPFWNAWQRWKDQGRRVAEDGMTCLWD